MDSVLGEIEKEKLEKEQREKEKIEKDAEAGDDDDMVGATRWQKAARRKQKQKEAEKGKQKAIIPEGILPVVEFKTKEQISEEKPLSRAERRKRIKEQILAEGEGEAFKGYRRRLW